MKDLHIHVSDKIYEWLRRVAFERRCSQVDIVREAIEEKMKKDMARAASARTTGGD